MTEAPNGRAQLRLAELGDVLDGAADVIAAGLPESADEVRAGLRGLRERLLRVHELCDQIDDRTWTAYTTGLERGLANLADELAADRDSAVEDVIYAHTGRLEVDGWVLRLDLAGRDAPAEGRELVASAARVLDEYHVAVTAGDDPSRTEVERALNELRGAVG